MTKAFAEASLRAAWRSVVEVRTCPPWAVLVAAERSAELVRHLERCAWCREDQDESAQIRSLLSTLPPVQSADSQASEPRTDDVWRLGGNRGGWGFAFQHYNPPEVLVLSRVPGRNAYRIAQVCREATFSGQDDVALPAPLDGFAEPWNVYLVKEFELASRTGTFPGAAADVERLANHAPTTQPRSLLRRFRALELEVGRRFSSGIPIDLSWGAVVPFPDQLRGHQVVARSRASWSLAAAATGSVDLVADMSGYSADVQVSVARGGAAELHARFELPGRISVAIFDESTARFRPLVFEETETEYLTVNAPGGDLSFTVSPGRSEDLVVLVFAPC